MRIHRVVVIIAPPHTATRAMGSTSTGSPSTTSTLAPPSPALAGSRTVKTQVASSTDVFAGEQFNPVVFINGVLPDERSLSKVEGMIDTLKTRVKAVDAEIMGALRSQSGSEARARDDFSIISSGIDALHEKMEEIRTKASESEASTREICRDIERYDRAKNHLTHTITQLRRLSMFASGTEQLEMFALRRQYRDAANLLQAASQLAAHFERYDSIPKIEELHAKYASVKNQLRSAVFDDFHTTWVPQVLAEDAKAQGKLRDACLVVNALEPHVREELVGNLTNRELTNYASVFSAHETGDFLGRIARRYEWIHRQLQSKQSMWAVFPAHWRVPQLLSVSLCKLTRAQLAEALDARGPHDVQKLLQAMHVTIEFEMDLDERFGTGAAGDEAELDGDEASASMVRQKYERIERAKQTEALRGGRALPMDSAAEAAATFMFRGSVSACFEDHLVEYVELESKQLHDQLDLSIRNETWAGDETNSKILSSATSVFLNIKKVFKRCSALTRGRTLFAIHTVFTQLLVNYSRALSARLATASRSAVDARRTEEQRTADLKCVSLIVNTAEYCNETIGPLGESMAKALEESFKDKIDMDDVEDSFSATLSDALNKLIGIVEIKSNLLGGMLRVNWGALEVVGDQSEYVDTFERTVTHALPIVRSIVSSIHHTFFCEKFASALAPKLYIAVFKCKRFSETGGQQLLLDMHAVKTILLTLPSIGAADGTGEPTAMSQSYTKMIAREMGKVEALLKVILSPADGLADAFKALLPVTANAVDYKAICDLKNVKPQGEIPHGFFPTVTAPASTKPLDAPPQDSTAKPIDRRPTPAFVPSPTAKRQLDAVTSKMSTMFAKGTASQPQKPMK